MVVRWVNGQKRLLNGLGVFLTGHLQRKAGLPPLTLRHCVSVTQSHSADQSVAGQPITTTKPCRSWPRRKKMRRRGRGEGVRSPWAAIAEATENKQNAGLRACAGPPTPVLPGRIQGLHRVQTRAAVAPVTLSDPPSFVGQPTHGCLTPSGGGTSAPEFARLAGMLSKHCNVPLGPG